MTEETLFFEALALPAAERAAYLDRVCAGQPTLRAGVEALLAANDLSGDFLKQPLAPTLPNAPVPNGSGKYQAELTPGSVIAGRYTLVESIGEGGMGEVWVAKQTEPVKRRVALKVIKAGMDTKAVLARFEQERQALALMEHPNIARVIDGGMTAEQRPYFVMELVNGLPLTKFCDEARLTPRQRLELFVPICQAVQHAHQKGIVHRDLKPSNILVTMIDGKPVPKVIDFGVAKATSEKLIDESLATQFGMVVGTLEYMSPEQAGFSGQDIDTRADIYSLGVILYELLTGLRPIDARRVRQAALAEMMRIIKEEEPSKPSTRLSTDEALPSLAALRQMEPRKLMALLRGDLDWVVMKCLEKDRNRRYETASSLARDVERYLADEPVEASPPSASYRLRKFVRRHRQWISAAALVVLALVAGIVGTTWQMIVAQRARAEAVFQESEAKKHEADANERVKHLRAVTSFFGDRLLALLNPNPNRLRVQGDPNMPLKVAVERSLANVDEYFKDMPLVEATVRQMIGIHLGHAGMRAEGMAQLQIALERFRANGMAHSIEALSTQHSLSRALYDWGRRDESLKLLDELRQYYRTKPPGTGTLAFVVLKDLGDYADGEGRYHDAVDICRELLAHTNEVYGPNHRGTYIARFMLAEALVNTGVIDEAQKELEIVVPLLRSGTRRDDDFLVQTLQSFGMVHHLAGQFTAADALLDEANRLAIKNWGPTDKRTLSALHAYANNLPKLKRYAEAAEFLRDCLSSRQRMEPDKWSTFDTQAALGSALLELKKLPEAEPLLLAGVAGLRKHAAMIPPPQRHRVKDTLQDLVRLYEDLGKADEAVRWRQELEAATKS